MEFKEKLLMLRKSKGLTQEELAKTIFVSRTAISKWEQGRGIPNIDSLKALSEFFCVPIDDLLLADALLSIAEKDIEQKESRMHSLIFGLLDCGFSMFLFLPLFGQREGGKAVAVSLFSLTSVSPFIKAVFLILVLLAVASGVALLAFQNCNMPFRLISKDKLSFAFGALCTLVFAVALQPYAAVTAFVFLLIKALLLINR